MRDAIIFDVDGTLADVSGIRHYVADERDKNFTAFHNAASLVHPMPQVVELATAFHDAGFEIIVVSSRKERWRFATARWLRKWNVPYSGLYLRGDGDQRRDVEVKRDIHDRLRREYRVVLAVDDNPSIVALWRSEGIPVVVVPGWGGTA